MAASINFVVGVLGDGPRFQGDDAVADSVVPFDGADGAAFQRGRRGDGDGGVDEFDAAGVFENVAGGDG